MPVYDSKEMGALIVDEPSTFQEVAQEALWLEQQRKHLQDQRALLDWQRFPRSWIYEKRCLPLTMRSFA